MHSQNFYKELENKFRGSQKVIEDRFAFYEPFLNVVKGLHKNHVAVDIGCGRGEWLELMVKKGFKAVGVDTDACMCEAVAEKGLKVFNKDALSVIGDYEDNSLSIVTGFHIAEHVPFDYLQKIFQESYRVLKPGGLMILETPNAENIKVATVNFYLDPTHNKPIPNKLLLFLSEYFGFEVQTIARLQAPIHLSDKHYNVTIQDVLEGVSPDYALIALKTGGDDTLKQPYSALFAAKYGLDQTDLAVMYEKRIADLIVYYDKRVTDLATLFDKRFTALANKIDYLFLRRMYFLLKNNANKIIKKIIRK